MSLLRSLGRLRIKASSSTPLFFCHLYCSYFLILCFKLSGNIRCDIHNSASLLFTLISSTLTVVDCKYFCNNVQHNLLAHKLMQTWTIMVFETAVNFESTLTCMFPISNENKTNPKMAMKIAKAISAT